MKPEWRKDPTGQGRGLGGAGPGVRASGSSRVVPEGTARAADGGCPVRVPWFPLAPAKEDVLGLVL